VWLVLASSVATYFRPEALLINTVVEFMIVVFAPNECRARRVAWALVLWTLLLVLAMAHLAAVRHENRGSSDTRFSVAFLAQQSPLQLHPDADAGCGWRIPLRPIKPRKS
jgi:hypothetical protein